MAEHVLLHGQTDSNAYHCKNCGTAMSRVRPTTSGVQLTCGKCGTRLYVTKESTTWRDPPTMRQRPEAAPGS